MNNINYTNDSLAIILLCSNLAINFKVDDVKPLSTVEWSKFAKIILNSSLKRPANLFNLSAEEIEKELLIGSKEAYRINKLLSKAGTLTFELNNLSNYGINVLTRADEEFPKVLKEKLKEKCPPLIYYCGDLSILEENLIGVVGSRNVEQDGLDFTIKLSKKIVSEGYSVISGGAKGVDSIAQTEVLSNGGKSAVFLADNMIKRISKKEIREAITNKKLLLMSAINPKSGFTVYSAMDRNKYIYALSKVTVVVSSDYNKGGTWAGATENFKNNWVPIAIRYEDNMPKGNKELLKLGGIKFEENTFSKKFIELEKSTTTCEIGTYDRDLLSYANENITVDTINNSLSINEENTTTQYISNDRDEQNFDAYLVLLEHIKKVLTEKISLNEFASMMNINKTQATTWLNRAIEEGHIKKYNKPVVYQRIK